MAAVAFNPINPIGRPTLTEKREASVKAMVEYLRVLDDEARDKIEDSIAKDEPIDIKLEKRMLHIKPNTPTWINLLVAYDQVAYTQYFSEVFTSGAVNANGNYLRGSKSSGDEAEDKPEDKPKKAPKVPKVPKEPKAKRIGPRVGLLKIGKTEIRFTGDFNEVYNAVQLLIANGVIAEKEYKPKSVKAKAPTKEDLDAVDQAFDEALKTLKRKTPDDEVESPRKMPRNLGDDESEESDEESDDD